MVFEDERQLGGGEQQGDGHDAPHLERHPEISGEIAPHDLIDRCQKQAEAAPAEGQRAPG